MLTMMTARFSNRQLTAKKKLTDQDALDVDRIRRVLCIPPEAANEVRLGLHEPAWGLYEPAWDLYEPAWDAWGLHGLAWGCWGF